MDVYNNLIDDNWQNLEAIEVPLSKWVDKQIGVHPDNGTLSRGKEKWAFEPWKNMKET